MKLVILDRDGVINEDAADAIKSPQEWRPIPGSLEAIVRLNRAGWHVVVATNQAGLARGLFDLDTLMEIHARMHRAVQDAGGQIDAVFFCPHGPEAGCECRKPRPGLFRDIARRLRINLRGVPAIGDALRDIQAAELAGASPVLVRTGKGAQTVADAALDASVPVYPDLAAVVDALLASETCSA